MFAICMVILGASVGDPPILGLIGERCRVGFRAFGFVGLRAEIGVMSVYSIRVYS